MKATLLTGTLSRENICFITGPTVIIRKSGAIKVSNEDNQVTTKAPLAGMDFFFHQAGKATDSSGNAHQSNESAKAVHKDNEPQVIWNCQFFPEYIVRQY